jgi:uncharacterized protein
MTTPENLSATVLDESQCMSMLRSTDVGHLAVIVEDAPEIFPINYAVDGATIVFRTATGTKLAAVAEGSSLAFEVDGRDEVGMVWSVVVKGHGHTVSEVDDVIKTLGLPLYPWSASPKPIFVRIIPAAMSGRRFALADPSTWASRFDVNRRAAPE